jgi:hypothetical protein
MAVYLHGGAYADLDTWAKTGIEEWSRGCGFALSLETEEHFCQWAFAALPRHPALAAVLDLVLDRIVHRRFDMVYEMFVHNSTGPAVYTEGIMRYLGLWGVERYRNLTVLLAEQQELLAAKGLCVYSCAEMQLYLSNMYSSQHKDMQSSTWGSWIGEVNDAMDKHREELTRQADSADTSSIL